MKRPVFLFAVFILLSGGASRAQDTLVDIKKVYPEELEMAGFELERGQEVKIEAVGLRYTGRRVDFLLGNSWILNSETREVVWELPAAESEPRDERDVVKFSGSVRLPKGKYEAYFATFPYYRYDGNGRWDRDWTHRSDRGRWTNIFFGRWRDDWFYDEFDRAIRDFKIEVKGDGKKLDRSDVRKNQDQFRSGALLSFMVDRDDEYATQGFMLDKPTELEIYSLGEANVDGNYDYGMIVDAKTFERVWQLTYDESDHAGGAEKNRMRRETVSLPAGRYAAIYVADDSHSPWEWNSPPPYDPEFWGLTIHAKSANAKSNFKEFDYEGYQIENAVVDFTRLRDEEFRSKGFTLKKAMDLRIYAIGEGRDGDMFDYGWIVDAKTRKKVWEMDFYDTDHAGGGHKNRMIDEVVRFEKGNYIAYFVTDDSHSHRDWNTSPPYDREHWGLTLVPTGDGSTGDIEDYQETDDKSVLARIARVRDHDFERANFTLKKDSKVRIYALGEGSYPRMYDVGWIEEAGTGKVVWEMTYRRTDHAGGARKNRLFDDIIHLQKGEYVVYYETDDSHSFNDWNASPPYDPESWGITVFLAEE